MYKKPLPVIYFAQLLNNIFESTILHILFTLPMWVKVITVWSSRVAIVSDNGTCFTSSEFESFLKLNGITHLKSASYHSSTNGLAERAVQIVKRG